VIQLFLAEGGITMKKSNVSRIISVLLALILSFSVCVQLAQTNRAAATSPDGGLGVFTLKLENKSEYYLCTAFLLYDEVTDRQYILADPIIARYVEDGFAITLFAKGSSVEAECIGDDGYFAYLTAGGMQNYQAFVLSGNDSEQIYITTQTMDEKNLNGIGENFDYCDISQWTEEDGVYISNDTIKDLMVGAPAVKDMSTLEVVGTISGKNGKTAFFPAVGYNFHSSFAVRTNDAAADPSEDIDIGEEKDSSANTALIIGAVVIVGMFILAGTKKKNKHDSNSDRRDETVALDPEPQIAPMVPTSPAPQWQIRGMEGPMAGQIFLLTSSLRFGRNPQNSVVFPGSTPGVSGNHCQVSIEHGQVVLRDLQSSYGTYLNNMKLEPQVGYNLQNGDMFTLAENAQTFRLERCGNMVQDMTPAVRSYADGKVYRADMNGRISFGRDPRNQVSFGQGTSSVSANHCILYRENGQLFLKDTNSTNGTFFDEENRLKPNKPYKVTKGTVFFLVSPQNTFVITEE